MIRFHLALGHDYHIIAVTETELDPLVPDSIVNLPNYTLLRHDRNTSGGGIALFIHHTLMVKQICSSTNVWTTQPGFPEYLFCEVTTLNLNPIFVAVVYRPPKAPFLRDTNFLLDLVSTMHDYSSKIILGDFNADQLGKLDEKTGERIFSEDAKFIRKVIEENNLYSVPFGATYHTKSSDTWLDLCLIDSHDPVVTVGKTNVDKDYLLKNLNKTDVPFSDGHDLISVTLSIPVPSTKQKPFTFKDYKNIDLDGFLSFLSLQDWSLLDNELTLDTGLDSAIALLNNHLHQAIDKFVPVKTINPNKRNHPWFTGHHKNLIADRDRLYRRFKRTRHPLDLHCYRTARDLAHQSIESARLDFYFARLSGITDPRQLWKELRHLGVCTGPDESPSRFTVDQLNEYFSSISFNSLEPSILEHIKTLPQDRENVLFDFSPVTLDELTTIIEGSSSQARGVDGIPQCVVRAALPVIGNYLCKIFNASLSHSYFPSLWKQSLVRSLNKVRTPSNLADHRPISLLCLLSKVLERLAFLQMSRFMESHNLIDEFQSGFRAGHSTQTALLKLTDDIRRGMDRGKITLLLLFDFSKAFDKVCHVTLLRKLEGLGFSNVALKWIASYLSGRQQAVIGKGDIRSSFRPLNMGVPQGSVLGPLLFAVYINDVADTLGPGIFHIIFADDLQLYAQCHISQFNEISRRLSIAADHIISWANNNNLEINVSKTKAIPFGSGPYIRDLNLYANDYIEIGQTRVKLIHQYAVWV